MTTKRLFDESSGDTNDGLHRPPKSRSRPSLSSVIAQVLNLNNMRNLWSALEPILRRVVAEEVERGLQRATGTRTRSLRIQQREETPASLKLVFANGRLPKRIFTGSKVVDADGNPLQIFLVDARGGKRVYLPHPTRIEVVVVDGDFPGVEGDVRGWTGDEFGKSLVRERTGKRPLLAGDSVVVLRDGVAVVGEIVFTDNSSWVRGRRFRLGARVVYGASTGGSGDAIRICEAISEPFVVKDHRGELNQKHHPPSLEDEVWRLEKIGKGGAFHNKLSSNGINSVQDFLKLLNVDKPRLREIMGMPEKAWNITERHAKECVLGNEVYIQRKPNSTLFLNAVCQVVRAEINGQTLHLSQLSGFGTTYLQTLVRDAYDNWNSLEVDDGGILLTQGVTMDYQYDNEMMLRPEQQLLISINGGGFP